MVVERIESNTIYLSSWYFWCI